MGVFVFKQDEFLLSQGLALGFREGMTNNSRVKEGNAKTEKKNNEEAKPAVSYRLLTTSQLFTVLFSPMETGLCPALTDAFPFSLSQPNSCGLATEISPEIC